MARTADRKKLAEWRRRFARHHTSGLTVAEFCRREGVEASKACKGGCGVRTRGACANWLPLSLSLGVPQGPREPPERGRVRGPHSTRCSSKPDCTVSACRDDEKSTDRRLASDVLGQNQLYRRRQETVSQHLLANAREERCRQQHVGVEDHPHEMTSRMSSSLRKPAASALDWSCSRFCRHRATARARSRMSSATSSAERHCLRPNSSSVCPESSGSMMVSDRAMSEG
jgi:hypothetical protein